MCAVSAVGDMYQKQWTIPSPGAGSGIWSPPVTREEFDALRREVLEMKELLIAAKKQDEENNEPDCEMEDKVALLRKVAEHVGISLEEVFGRGPPRPSTPPNHRPVG